MDRLSRRDWLKLVAAGAVGPSLSGWLDAMAIDIGANPARKRSCILLWMNGGPSQMDTFDLKPGHANGGPYKEIQTSAPGLRISEYLPKIAKFGDHMAVVRSMSTKEGEHQRATFLMRTGYMPTGPIQYPPIGSLISKELGASDSPLPNCVSIAPFRFISPAAFGPGFLGPQYAPLIVGDGGQFQQPGQNYEQALKVQDIDLPGGVDRAHADARIDLLQEMEKEFVESHPGVAPLSHQMPPRRSTSRRRKPSCATPTAGTSSARAACWPAASSSAACPSSRSRSPASTTTGRSAGTRTTRTSRRSSASARYSTRHGGRSWPTSRTAACSTPR
jgi:hypothetical protein